MMELRRYLCTMAGCVVHGVLRAPNIWLEVGG
jgi:hypothetical protein